ncbi:hypothetical protein [Nocardia otitidiscaviarum]|uniref:hypothetical protein n=1 Tax=Nocardia otitidiscaviarum TaxID=1823 RepID=UPI0024579BBB|nr:hypothetical protein [Nocardia otitidiscaviarum]
MVYEPAAQPAASTDFVGGGSLVFAAAPSTAVEFTASAALATPSVPSTAAAFTSGGALAADAVAGIAFNDSFTRVNLGANWAVSAHPPVIASNQVRAGTTGANSETTYYPAQWASPLTTDGQETSIVLVAPASDADLTLGGGLIVRGNTSTFDRVELIATATSMTIYTVIGGTRTQRATASVTVNNLVTIRLSAVDNVYRGYLGGSATTPSVTWTDSGGLIPVDSSTRRTGIVAVSAKDGGGAATYGWELDDWIGRNI